jgi:hypothetical protein
LQIHRLASIAFMGFLPLVATLVCSRLADVRLFTPDPILSPPPPRLIHAGFSFCRGTARDAKRAVAANVG